MSSAKFLFARQRVSAADLVSVAAGGAVASIDTAVADKLLAAWTEQETKEQRNQKPGTIVEPGVLPSAIAASNSRLSTVEARAFMAARLVSLLHGRSLIRPTALHLIIGMLNAGIAPIIGSNDQVVTDRCASEQLLRAIHGLGEAEVTVDGVVAVMPIADAFQKASLQAVESFSAKEIVNFLQGQPLTTTLTALALNAANLMLDTSDAIAALTCEAVQATLEPFDSAHFDVARPLKGCVQSAQQLRALLEGSRNTNDTKRVAQDAEAIRCIPQMHGPAREAVDSIARSVTIDLNAGENAGLGSSIKSGAALHGAAQTFYAAQLASALQLLAHASLERSRVMVQWPNVTESAAAGAADTAGQAAAQAVDFAALQQQIAVVDDLQRRRAAAEAAESSVSVSAIAARSAVAAASAALSVVSAEANVALALLNAREKVILEASEAALQAAEQRRLAREAEAVAAGKKVPAAKSEPKAAKGLVLANATRAIRAHLSTASPSSLIDHLNVVEAGAWRTLLTPLLAGAQQVGRSAKIPKGTRDTQPEQMAVREAAFAKILRIFRAHGAVGIDTPVFELRETLTGKYGEDSKLIYDLADQGGELLSLRYDLTVPFARFLAMSNNTQIKRYHIAKVYRRDNPAMNRGRFREFHQCDYDVAGTYGSMIPDADVIKVLTEILDSLQIGKYVVKLNHRRLLDAMMAACGVPSTKFRAICSAIDKLDKESWEDVRGEMISQKGLDADVADRIGTFVRADSAYVKCKHDPMQVLAMLQAAPEFQPSSNGAADAARVAFEELAILFRYLAALGALPKVHFDMSLARGLDYYTGVIYEAMLTETDRVGSIAAGGRYDGLVGRFSGQDVPAVGVSIGIERILAIMEEQERARNAGGKIRATSTEVLVASVGSGMLEARMSLCAELWAAGVKAEFVYKENPKLPAQLAVADEAQIPLAVIFGSSEIEKGTVKVKNLIRKVETEVSRSEMVAFLQRTLADPTSFVVDPLAAAPVEEATQA